MHLHTHFCYRIVKWCLFSWYSALALPQNLPVGPWAEYNAQSVLLCVDSANCWFLIRPPSSAFCVSLNIDSTNIY